MENETPMVGPTLDEVIARLHELREQYGGEVKVIVCDFSAMTDWHAIKVMEAQTAFPHPYYVNHYEREWNKCGDAREDAALKAARTVIVME